jgi:hypothetical protein
MGAIQNRERLISPIFARFTATSAPFIDTFAPAYFGLILACSRLFPYL